MKRFVLEIMAVGALSGGLAFAQLSHERSSASRIEAWLVDPYGAVDGVLLHDARTFYFSATTGRALTRACRLEDPVHIDADSAGRVLVDERNGVRLALQRPDAPESGGAVTGLRRTHLRGYVTDFFRLPEGHIGGFMLTGGQQIRVPLALGDRLHALRSGDLVSIDGLTSNTSREHGIVALTIRDANGRAVLER